MFVNRIRKIGSFKLGKEIEKGVFFLMSMGSIPCGDSEFFLFPVLATTKKNFFLYSFTEVKSYHLSYSIYQREFFCGYICMESHQFDDLHSAIIWQVVRFLLCSMCSLKSGCVKLCI